MRDGFANSVEKSLLGEIRNDRIVDFKERTITLRDREDLGIGWELGIFLFGCCSPLGLRRGERRQLHGVYCHILTQEPEQVSCPHCGQRHHSARFLSDDLQRFVTSKNTATLPPRGI